MKEKLLEIFNGKLSKPLDIDELYKLLDLHSSIYFTILAKTLNDLEDDFLITHNRRGEFAPLSYFKLAVGVLEVKDGGYGFVDTDEGGIFIPSSSLKNAITYDTVLIKVSSDDKGRLEGNVERVLKRGNPYIYGILKINHGKYYLYSIDDKIKLRLNIEKDKLKNAKLGQIVKALVLHYNQNNTADGEIVDILGFKDTSGTDISALVYSANVPYLFSSPCLDEVKKIPLEVDITKLDKRVNLTGKKIITIDGDDAKDLDDAISVEKLDNGNYKLGVYIADVSNYVKEDDNIDKDAVARGTSIYLPDRVIPMLPKELSNGICSLNEGVIRLVMAVEMEINNSGEVVNSSIFEGYISSAHRMTYHNVNKILLGEEKLKHEYSDIVDMLNVANELSHVLYNMRIKRGAFEFETPETKLILDEHGKVKDILMVTRSDAECMIEEFMLICNETVANTMTWLDVPFLYRVHEEPKQEKITKLLLLVENFGNIYKIKNAKSTVRVLQQILKDNSLNDNNLTDEEKTKRSIINDALIKSMAKAKYQETNIGHFGLASKCYTHFTSPIRRYPDLLVHRLIKEFLLNEKTINKNNVIEYYNHKVNSIGISASKQERVAERLERDCDDYKKCEYMEHFLGDKFEGTISSITSFGVYVTLDNTICGLSKFMDMHDDYYDFNEIKSQIKGTRYGITYTLGDRVKVRVMNVHKEIREINFRLLGKVN